MAKKSYAALVRPNSKNVAAIKVPLKAPTPIEVTTARKKRPSLVTPI